MSSELKHRRGTAAAHASFIGAQGEITVKTDTNEIVVHDGVTPGGKTGGGYMPAGTGAVATNVQSKLRETVSVFDFMTAEQIADVRAGTASVDVTAAIQAAITASLSVFGGGVYFPNGTYKITSAINIPFSTGWKIYGQSRGSVIIKQFTNNTPIFNLVGDLTHGWEISELSFNYNAQQTSSHPNSVAIYFNSGNNTNIFNFRVSRCTFYNARRCMAINESLSQMAVWGSYISGCVVGGSVTGAFFSAKCASAVGQPNIIIRDSYIDCQGATEPSIIIVAGDVVKLDGIEFNNGVYNGFVQMDISTSFGVEVSSCKNEVASIVGNGALWDFAQSYVVAQNVKTVGATASGGGVAIFLRGGSGGTLSVRGLYGAGTRSDGGAFVPYLFDKISIADGITLSGNFTRDIRSVLGYVNTPQIETVMLTQNRTQSRNDVSVTLTMTDARVQYFNTALTANRTVTLPNTGILDGTEFEIVRYGLGAFTLTVIDPLSGKSITIPSATRGAVRYRATSSGEWLPMSYSTF